VISGRYFQNHPPPLVIQLDIFRNFRPGPDQAHIALKDVDQLWQFVDLERPQPGPDSCDTVVARGSDGKIACRRPPASYGT